jgi:hypothetical protein
MQAQSKIMLHLQLNDLLVERDRLMSSLNQKPQRDYSVPLAFAVIVGWWMIICICVAFYLRSIVGLYMLIFSFPATLVVFAIWFFVSRSSRSQSKFTPFQPARLDREAISARLMECDRRISELNARMSQ